MGCECVNMNADRELDNDVCSDLSPDSTVSPPVTAALHCIASRGRQCLHQHAQYNPLVESVFYSKHVSTPVYNGVLIRD